MLTTIHKIVGVRKYKDTLITTIEINDGGEILQATGVGKFSVGSCVYVYHEDRYNRLGFKRA